MKLSLDQKIVVSLLVFLILCLLVSGSYWRSPYKHQMAQTKPGTCNQRFRWLCPVGPLLVALERKVICWR
jgi:hypothetical protein